ncbi:unnamed protein product [Arabidopsis halleri]
MEYMDWNVVVIAVIKLRSLCYLNLCSHGGWIRYPVLQIEHR